MTTAIEQPEIVIDTASKISSVAVVVTNTTLLLFASLLPLLSWGYLAWLRQWRRLGLGLLASAVAMGLVWLIGAEVLSRFSSPDLVFPAPDWICGDHVADSTQACVSGDASLHTYYLAGGVAFFSSLAPWMTKRQRRAAWITIIVLVVVRTIQGLNPPLDEFLVIVLVPAGPKRRNLEMLAAAFAVLMVLSRVYLRATGCRMPSRVQRSGLESRSASRRWSASLSSGGRRRSPFALPARGVRLCQSESGSVGEPRGIEPSLA